MDKCILLSNYIRKGIFLIPKNNPNNTSKWIIDFNFEDKEDSEFEKAIKILSKNKKFMNYLKKII